MGLSNEIITVIKAISDKTAESAPFDKTKNGIIQDISIASKEASVLIDGVNYDNIRIYGMPSELSKGDTVKVLIPQNNINNAYVIVPTKQQELQLSKETITAFEDIGYVPSLI